MKRQNIPKHRSLAACLTLVIAAAYSLAPTAQGAVVFYGKVTANDTNPNPNQLAFAVSGNFRKLQISGGTIGGNASGFFTGGADLAVTLFFGQPLPYYVLPTSALIQGATLGSSNYAMISFGGDDGGYEAVAQFGFESNGNARLIAIATTNPIPNPQDLSAVGGPTLSISTGKALIDAAAVPEPSGLAMLTLATAGLLIRRKRARACS